MCCILNKLCYIWVLIHTKTKISMTNSQVIKYLLGMVVSFFGMLVHIFQMIETSKGIHLVCFLLWFVIFSGLTYVMGKRLQRF
jgi:hypothetical protein